MDDFRVNSYAAYGDRPLSVWNACSGYGGAAVEKDVGGYLLGTRLYLPIIRRFAHPDAMSPFDAGGLNRYAYCGGDPVNRIDPSGRSWQVFWDALVGVAEAATAGGRRIAAAAHTAPGAVRDRVRPAATAATRYVRRQGSAFSDATLQWFDETIIKVRGRRTRTVRHGGGAEITIHEGRGAPRRLRSAPVRDDGLLGSRPTLDYEPQWHVNLNAKNMPVYAADSSIVTAETFGQMIRYMTQSRQSGEQVSASNIVLITGGHGSSDGRNWTASGEWISPAGLEDAHRIIDRDRLARNYLFDGLEVVNLRRTTSTRFKEILNGPKAVFFDTCFGLADRHLTETLSIDAVTVYDRHA